MIKFNLEEKILKIIETKTKDVKPFTVEDLINSSKVEIIKYVYHLKDLGKFYISGDKECISLVDPYKKGSVYKGFTVNNTSVILKIISKIIFEEEISYICKIIRDCGEPFSVDSLSENYLKKLEPSTDKEWVRVLTYYKRFR